jgi:hypothetical protein
MRIGRKIIIPAIVSLGTAASIFASSAVVATATTTPVAATSSGIYYHG